MLHSVAMRVFALALMAVLLGIPTLAHGQESTAATKWKIAVLAVEISGDGPPQLRQQLQAQIADGLVGEGVEVIGYATTSEALKHHPELVGCSSSTCLKEIGELVGANRFVRAVVIASGANYEIKLELLASTGESIVQNRAEDSCAVCTISELNEKCKSAAGRLLQPSEKFAPVRIATNPPGAKIYVDESQVGVSPVDLPLKPGRYSVVAKLEGHITATKSVEVRSASEVQRFELPLAEEALIGPPAPRFRTWKWVTGGAAIGLVGIGSYLAIVDGNPTNCASKRETCKEVHDGLVPGLLGISIGAVAGAASAWMYWSDRKREKARAQWTLSLSGNGGQAGMRLEF